MKVSSYIFLLGLAILACNDHKNPAAGRNLKTHYVLDTAWVQACSNYIVSQPTGIGIDRNNHIFIFQRTGRKWIDSIPDSLISQNTILELDNETGKMINAWGAGYFIMPHGLTVDKDDNIWVTDVGLHQVFKFTHEGNLLMKSGEAKVPGNDSAHFNLPTDIAVAPDGSYYVSDGYGNSRIVKFSSSGKYLRSWGSYGKEPGEFNIPHGLAIDKNNTLYVADRQNNRVQLFDTSGRFLREFENKEDVEQLPSVAIDISGRLYAIDYDSRKNADSTANGSTFFMLDTSGHTIQHIGATGSADRTPCWFHDIAVDSKGNIYVGDIAGLKVLKFKPL